MLKHLDRINKITTCIFITLILVMYLLAKFTNVKLSPITPLISLLLFVPMMIGATLFTLTFLANLIRSKNSILIGLYSVITFINYKLSDIYTSKLIYLTRMGLYLAHMSFRFFSAQPWFILTDQDGP